MRHVEPRLDGNVAHLSRCSRESSPSLRLIAVNLAVSALKSLLSREQPFVEASTSQRTAPGRTHRRCSRESSPSLRPVCQPSGPPGWSGRCSRESSPSLRHAGHLGRGQSGLRLRSLLSREQPFVEARGSRATAAPCMSVAAPREQPFVEAPPRSPSPTPAAVGRCSRESRPSLRRPDRLAVGLLGGDVAALARAALR